MSEYCKDEEFQEIIEIIEKFAELHPDVNVNFTIYDVPVVVPASRLLKDVKKETEIGKAFLGLLRKIADQNNITIVDVAKEGFRTGCGSSGGSGCGDCHDVHGRHRH